MQIPIADPVAEDGLDTAIIGTVDRFLREHGRLPVALAELKKEGKCPKHIVHRPANYLNNVIKADHGKLKRLINPVQGFDVTRAPCKEQASTFNVTGDIRSEARTVERGCYAARIDRV